jgi:hypothetical protein
MASEVYADPRLVIEMFGKDGLKGQPAAASAGYGVVDLEAMRRELTDGFIMREYAQQFGIMDMNFKEAATRHYLNDSQFHAKVQAVVSGVMQIVQKYTP